MDSQIVGHTADVASAFLIRDYRCGGRRELSLSMIAEITTEQQARVAVALRRALDQ
jgi:hypothetical protein